MPPDTIPLTVDIPIAAVQALLRDDPALLARCLTLNGHASPNGHAPRQEDKETRAPVLPSSTGAP
jgi:hypothetical protein